MLVDISNYFDTWLKALSDMFAGAEQASTSKQAGDSDMPIQNIFLGPIIMVTISTIIILTPFGVNCVKRRLRVNASTPIKLGPFKRNADLRKWFEDFDKIMNLREVVDNKLKSRLLFTHIEAEDAEQFEPIFAMFDDDYPSLKQYFIESTDKTPVKHDQLRVAFQSRNQQPDESIFDYFEALTNLGTKAFRDTSTKKGIQKIIKDRFLNGLHDQAIRAKLSFEFDCENTNLATLLSEA